jgi:hypothetical protein
MRKQHPVLLKSRFQKVASLRIPQVLIPSAFQPDISHGFRNFGYRSPRFPLPNLPLRLVVKKFATRVSSERRLSIEWSRSLPLTCQARLSRCLNIKGGEFASASSRVTSSVLVPKLPVGQKHVGTRGILRLAIWFTRTIVHVFEFRLGCRALVKKSKVI